MTVRERLGLYRAGRGLLPPALGIAVLGALLGAGADPVPAFVGAIAVLFVSERLYPRVVERRARVRLLQQMHARLLASLHDPRRAREVLDEIADGYRTLGVKPDLYLTLMSGVVLTVESRWAEARAVLMT